MKIAFFEIDGWEEEYLKERLKDHHLAFYNKPLSFEDVRQIEDFDIVSVFVYSKIDGPIIEKLPGLKLITARSTGFDHIDLEPCEKRNITVCNVPFYGESTVAEHAFALILCLSRKIHKAHVRVLRHDFSIEGLKGFDLKEKTLGVIGSGHIGLNVARIAKGFRMNVLVYDINQNRLLAEFLEFEYVSLEELLKRSDIITLHIPYNKYTHHLINKDTIKLIKKGAVLINTSRGGVVDTRALIEGLDENILSGVGLDVLEGEELIIKEKQLLDDQKTLLSKDNVVFTPHIAFYSQEALERILETTIQSIVAFSSGDPKNTVQ